MHPLNFSTHALECLTDPRLSVLGQAQQECFTYVADALRKAPKFLLPEGGRPMDDVNSVARMFEELRLPFACVALEYEANGAINTAIETRSSKRIALAWDLRFGVPEYIQKLTGASKDPRNALAVQSISYIDQVEMWAPIAGIMVLNLEGVVKSEKIQHFNENDPEYLAMVRHRIPDVSPSNRFFSYPTEVFGWAGDEESYRSEELRNALSADTADELFSMMSFAALTACANVEFDLLKASPALNKKRAGRKKELFFDVHVLMLAGAGYKASPKHGSGSGAGGHASPRTHLRRGHVRRLADKNVWVNAAVVNGAADAAPTPRYKLV